VPPRLPRRPPDESIPVEGPGTGLSPEHRAHVDRARAIARLLDDAIRIPGTRFGIGLDPVLGLVPGAGDLVGALLSGYVVVVAVRVGVPRAVVARMIGNIGIDALVGAVPVLGDLFDAGFRSNLRNVALLERWTADPAGARRGSAGLVALVVLVLLLAAGGAVVLAVDAARALAHAAHLAR
jgi:hypothetical protein